MTSIKHKTIIKFIVHALFWVFYIIVLFLFDPPYENNINWYSKIELDILLLVSGIAYLNDQLLLPYFFKKKYYSAYAFIIFVLIFIATIFYSYYLMGNFNIFTCFSINYGVILTPLIFLSLIWVVLRFYEKQKELEKAHNDRLEIELKFLKSQINPHVLFNSLNTIYAQALKESDTIAEMILMLSENLKYVLNQSTDTLVDLEKDLTFIDNYLEFQKLRTQGINNISYKKEIDSYNHSIAPLILIDLIENAFKHAVYKGGELSNINIYLSVQNGKLHFYCENEFDINLEKGKSTQIGLKNLQQRLLLIYKDNYKLNINKKNGTFKVDLKINLE